MTAGQTGAAACTLCPRRCGAARNEVEGGGLCRMGTAPRVAKATPHYGEEPCLSGTKGSGAVFFCGCALRCAYCQNAPISWDNPSEYGRVYTVDELADAFRSLEARGVHNINLVGATPFLSAVIDALRIARPAIPVVYNTSGYETLEDIAALNGLIDIYLPDYKYSDSALASRLSGAADYPAVARAAILAMRDQTGPAIYDPGGTMLRGTIVRHLILPGYIRESIQSLNWLASNLPPGTPVSLMGQFTPTARSALFGLDRPLTHSAYRRVKAHRMAIGLSEGYNQGPDASGEAMIPVWDG
ncbi:MAG: radical SAM protein [Oscillospiraceae bacterium]|nr:radical SAM protein [Oscillospiraceae bacterium]